MAKATAEESVGRGAGGVPPVLFVLAAALLWSTGGLFINATALASGVCFAFFLLLLRHQRAGRVNRASSVIYGNVIVCLVTAPAFARAAAAMTTRDVVIVAYLGVVQIGLAYTLFTLGIARGV